MLWLNKKSIQDCSVNDYIKIAQENGFSIRRILGYSKKSCVFLTSKNTVIKILNPDLSKYQVKNFITANILFLKCGIKIPHILSTKRSSRVYIVESQYIDPLLFFERKSIIEADKAFFNIFDKLSKVEVSKFGPFITRKEFLPPAFVDCSYFHYWDNQFNYFLAKIPSGFFHYRVKRFYKKLRSKVKQPNKFIPSHSDISPKHVFMYRSQVGCIDLEESMYLDTSFMWAIWYVRTMNQHNKKSNNIFFKQFFSCNLDFDRFNFHFYRELLIQYYYEKSLDKFIKDYSKFSANFN